MGRARPIKTLCFMRIEWLKFDDYVPARITKKSLGFVPFLVEEVVLDQIKRRKKKKMFMVEKKEGVNVITEEDKKIQVVVVMMES